MKFITVEQFKDADKKVKKAIMEWWKPSIGDIVLYTCFPTAAMSVLTTVLELEDILKIDSVPLLTVSQLIEFIDDFIGCKIDILCNANGGYIIFPTLFEVGSAYKEAFKTGKLDLLEALWYVAQKVVME